MSIERNIIFLYPISAKLQELKKELEEDENNIVYELDSVNEYGQLIGVMEHSVTFSSDLKKTEAYLSESKQFVRTKTNRNILMQDKNIPPHIFSKYQKLGLNEVLQEGANIKSLTHKINMFFSPFEQALKREEEAKNKAVTGFLKMENKDAVIGKKKEFGQDRMRVEKMAIMDDDLDDGKKKKRKSSGFDQDAMLSLGAMSNFTLKKNSGDTPLFKSPFDEMQRKKVAQFNAVEAKSKLKKSNFQPIVGELGNNPHRKAFGIKPPGELNQRKASGLDFKGAEIGQRKFDFKARESELERRKLKTFEEAEKAKKKRKKFEEQLRELERKKVKELDESAADPKKRKIFEEVMADLERKKAPLDEVELDIKKKKSLFEEVEADYNKKKHQIEELDLSPEKKKALFEELEDLNRKKAKLLDELEDLNNKKYGMLDDLSGDPELKRMLFEEANADGAKKGTFVDQNELDRKKGATFDEVEHDRKAKHFEELEIELDKKKGFQEIDNDLNRKKGAEFNIEDGKKKNGNIEFPDQEKNKKRGTFEEVPRESHLKGIKNLDIQIGAPKKREELDKGTKKEHEEQVLDYSQFRKQQKEGKLKLDEEKQKEIEKKALEKLLEEPEYTFYENLSYGLEYLVIYNDFLLKEKVETQNLFKFIHFALLKEYDGVVSFYLVNPNKKDDMEAIMKIQKLYSGHQLAKENILVKEFEELEQEKAEAWYENRLPFWEDETYQVEINEFVYPYFEEGEFLGFAVSHFKNSVKSHQDASKIELLLMGLKGAILEEHSVNDMRVK